MKLFIKPHNDIARELYRNHGHFHDGDAGLDLYVLEDIHFQPEETKAIKLALGEEAYRVPISSSKSMTGHLLGAGGALEAAFCVLAIQNGVIPPTTNLADPDPDCDLDYTPNHPRTQRVDVAMSNSFGFGGQNASLVVKMEPGGGVHA